MNNKIFFVEQALHVCLDKYLEMFRRTVITGKQNSIAEIFLRTSPLIRQIRALAKLLAIHPTGKILHNEKKISMHRKKNLKNRIIQKISAMKFHVDPSFLATCIDK